MNKQMAQLEEKVEILVQQTSAHHSDLLKKITDLDKKVDTMQVTIDGWKFGGKLTFWIFVAVGGVVTWVLKTFGLHISLGH